MMKIFYLWFVVSVGYLPRIIVTSKSFLPISYCFSSFHNVSNLNHISRRTRRIRNESLKLLSTKERLDEAALSNMKVVDLKKLLTRDVPVDQRRGSSIKLTKKADIVSFLAKFYNSNDEELVAIDKNSVEKDDDLASINKIEVSTTVKSKSRVRCMPKLPSDVKDNLDSEGNSEDEKSNKEKSIAEEFQEFVYKRYPMLDPSQYENEIVPVLNGIGPEDIRAECHPMLKSLKGKTSDFDIFFVGTASCIPSHTRGVSCTALRLNWNRDTRSGVRQSKKSNSENIGGTWLFDAGECTQLQIQNVPALKLSKITKLFMTHCHGDHTFGLPGLLCLMGQAAMEKSRSEKPNHVIDIYGPQGLRQWLRVAIRYSQSRIVPKYRVHELMDVCMAPEWRLSKYGRYYYQDRANKADWRGSVIHTMKNTKMDRANWINFCSNDSLDDYLPMNSSFGEVPGGTQIYPNYKHPDSVDGSPVYELIGNDEVVVTAAPMSHGVPCVGYVVDEQPKSGRIKPELVQPVVERNADALREIGVRHPMKILSEIKSLSPGDAYTFPDGTIIQRDDVVEGDRPGRKVVICGDTCDARALEKLGKDADVLIHECTNAFLQGIDKQTNLKGVTIDAIRHGHSTPQIAGAFAKKIRAKKLLLNHFSARYRGDQSLDSIKVMTRIERQAIEASGLDEYTVAASWDFMEFPIFTEKNDQVEK